MVKLHRPGLIWDLHGPLIKFVSKRKISNAGFNMGTKVKDLVNNQNWKWPVLWSSQCHGIDAISKPLFQAKDDKLWWLSKTNAKLPFSVSHAWESLKEESEKVTWYRVVWFPQCIPKHSLYGS